MNYKNADGTWTAIGIVAYDSFLSCRDHSTIPRAFTRVSSYVDWIVNVTSDGNLNSSSTITESFPKSTSQSISTSSASFTNSSVYSTIVTPSTSWTTESLNTSDTVISISSTSTPAPIEPRAKNITSLDPIPFSSTFTTKMVSFDVCGKSNGPGADPNNGTIQLIKSNDFPWLVNFYYDTLTEDDPFWCSGSIIGSKWILTAASCNLTLERYLFANHYVNHNIIIK